MAGVNKVIIVGHLGRDPEVKTFPNGGKVVNMRLATSETWKDKQSGEKKERTEWHSVAIFNEALGGIAEKYLKKGSLCYIEGSLETRKWQDQSGADKYTTEIVLRPFNGTLTLLGGSGGGARDSGSTQSDGVDRAANGTARYDDGGSGGSTGGGRSDIDDEIPF